MKAISLESQLTSASTRADGSLSLRFATSELQPTEKAAIFEIQGMNIKLLMQPLEGNPDELVDVKSEFQTKTPSMRLRAVLYVAWEQAGKPGEWETFYTHKMNFYIEDIKRSLNPK